MATQVRGRKRRIESISDEPATADSSAVNVSSKHSKHEQTTAGSSDLDALTSTLEDIRGLITCKICFRMLYEPYTMSCGHTFCYSCLTSWFSKSRNRKTCPDCRTSAREAPAPAYLVRELTQKFVQHVELLPEGETIEQHIKWQKEESDHVENDKRNTDANTGGLFKGQFRNKPWVGPGFQIPLRDEEDGVERCPRCTWEIEDHSGMCIHCGWTAFPDTGSDTGWEEASESAFPASDLGRRPYPVSMDSSEYSTDEEEEVDGDLEIQDHDHDFEQQFPWGSRHAASLRSRPPPNNYGGFRPAHEMHPSTTGQLQRTEERPWPRATPRAPISVASSSSSEGSSSDEEQYWPAVERDNSDDSSAEENDDEENNSLNGFIDDGESEQESGAESGEESESQASESTTRQVQTSAPSARRRLARRAITVEDSEDEDNRYPNSSQTATTGTSNDNDDDSDDSDEGGQVSRGYRRRSATTTSTQQSTTCAQDVRERANVATDTSTDGSDGDESESVRRWSASSKSNTSRETSRDPSETTNETSRNPSETNNETSSSGRSDSSECESGSTPERSPTRSIL